MSSSPSKDGSQGTRGKDSSSRRTSEWQKEAKIKGHFSQTAHQKKLLEASDADRA
jgi:hypothetical protein